MANSRTNIVNTKGFTLIELLVGLIIAGIVFGFAIPAMQSGMANTRLTTKTNELVGDLNFARTEAIKRNARVVMCSSTDSLVQAPAVPSCSTSATGWEVGRIIFVDANSDGSYGAGDTLLRKREPAGNDLTIRGNGASTAARITFDQRGLTTLPDDYALAEPHQIRLCDGNGTRLARAVAISSTGRTAVMRNGQASNGSTITVTCP